MALLPFPNFSPTNILEAAKDAFASENPTEFDWFRKCEEAGDPKTNGFVQSLIRAGLKEHGWALAQLFYDQSFKESVRVRRRFNLAHPAFGIVQAAMAIGHSSAVRHYGLITQIADVLGEADEYRAGAAFVVSDRLGWTLTERFIKKVQRLAAPWNSEAAIADASWPEPHRPGEPIYPEALLAAYWFPSQRERILGLAPAASGVPFADLLLAEARRVSEARKAEAEVKPADEKAKRKADASGTLFEAATALLLSATPGFDVRGGYKDASSQTDIVVMYRRDAFCEAFFPEGYALVECKHWNKPVDAHIVREFGARCLLQDIQLGVLVTRKGITGTKDKAALRNAELERRRFMSRGTHILVLAKNDLVRKVRELRGLEGVLREDLERLRFGVRH